MTTDWKRAAIIAAESEARAYVGRDALEAEVERLTAQTSTLESAMKDLARWLEAGATISKRDGVTNCLVMQEDGTILGGLHVAFPQAAPKEPASNTRHLCMLCASDGKCMHRSKLCTIMLDSNSKPYEFKRPDETEGGTHD